MNLNYVNKRPSGVGGLNIKKKEEMAEERPHVHRQKQLIFK